MIKTCFTWSINSDLSEVVEEHGVNGTGHHRLQGVHVCLYSIPQQRMERGLGLNQTLQHLGPRDFGQSQSLQ